MNPDVVVLDRSVITQADLDLMPNFLPILIFPVVKRPAEVVPEVVGTIGDECGCGEGECALPVDIRMTPEYRADIGQWLE